MAINIKGYHILIQVFSMPASLKFYRDTLGFMVINDSGDGDNSSWVMLRANGAVLMLNDQYDPAGEIPDAPPAERTQWHHDTLIYFDCPDIDAAAAHIRNNGYTVKGPFATGYNYRAINLTDPDGYNIFLQWPENE